MNNEKYKYERTSTPEPDHIMLSFNGDAHTQMAVTWRTSTDISTGYAILKRENSSETTMVTAESRKYKTDIDESYYHSVTFSNLKPGTKYCYSVGNDTYRSTEFSFSTEENNNKRFSFIIISDHQKGNPTLCPDYSCVNRLLSKALKEHLEIKFILTAGDNCDNGQNDLQWNGMFSGLKGIIESIPYMMTTGNHDNRGFISYYPEPTGKFYLEHADLFDFQFRNAYPLNGPEQYTTENYSFDYGNAHFTIMGINAPEEVGKWAYSDMQSSDKTWKLATYHFPIYPVMPEGQNDDGYPGLRKAVEQGRPDILFEGHEHSFARTFPIVNDELFDKPSQGTVHYIAGNGGGNIYHSNSQKVWHSAFYPQEEHMGLYTIVDINENVLTATAYMEDGRIVDKFTIDKATDTILPYALAPRYDRTKMCFKGRMLEISVRGCYAEYINNMWFAPLGAVIQAIGGKVEKYADSLVCELYNHKAIFTIGSKDVKTELGTITLTAAPVFIEGQLYVPVAETASIFELDWYYAKHNNFINWNTPHEEKPIYRHPV